MKTNTILIALAGASLVAIGPALSQGRGGGHGGGHGGGQSVGAGGSVSGTLNRGGMDVRGDVRGSTRMDTRVRGLDRLRSVDTRSERRQNSQGPDNASDRALDRANENSVLHDPSVTPPALSALETGLTVRTSDGTTIGTISRINRSSDGRISSVLVAGADGQRRNIRLAPHTLSIDGEIVTTTTVLPN